MEAKADNCPICFAEYGADVKITICAHKFHSSCLNEWLADNETCPMCRTEIQVKMYYDNKHWKPQFLFELKLAIERGFDFDSNYIRLFDPIMIHTHSDDLFEYYMQNVPNSMSMISPVIFLHFIRTCNYKRTEYLLKHGYKDKAMISRAFKMFGEYYVDELNRPSYLRYDSIGEDIYPVVKQLFDFDFITLASRIRIFKLAILNNKLDFVKFYFRKGINARYVDKYTFQNVKKSKNLEMYKFLTERGVNVN
jgi:hypothetical protein